MPAMMMMMIWVRSALAGLCLSWRRKTVITVTFLLPPGHCPQNMMMMTLGRSRHNKINLKKRKGPLFFFNSLYPVCSCNLHFPHFLSDPGVLGASFHSEPQFDEKNPSTGRWILSIYQKSQERMEKIHLLVDGFYPSTSSWILSIFWLLDFFH